VRPAPVRGALALSERLYQIFRISTPLSGLKMLIFAIERNLPALATLPLKQSIELPDE
jgi:hypothetical protein